MPVVAICSQERHFRAPPSNGTSQKKRCIDLHTVEMPIATRNGNLTVEETDLGALVVDGVLNIYVVERECTSTRAGDGLGKDALFAASDHWVGLINVLRIATDKTTASQSTTDGARYGYVSLLSSRCFRDGREAQGGYAIPGRISAHD